MALLLSFLLLLVLGLILLGALAARAYNQAARGAITQHFQDAEYILERRRPPPRWSLRPWLRRGRSVSNRERLAAIVAHFEHSPFVEDEGTRAELLRQLREVGDDWAAD